MGASHAEPGLAEAEEGGQVVLSHQDLISNGREWKHRATALVDQPAKQARYYAEMFYYFVHALAVKTTSRDRLLQDTMRLFHQTISAPCFDLTSPNRKVALLTLLVNRLDAVLLMWVHRDSKASTAALLYKEVGKYFKEYSAASSSSPRLGGNGPQPEVAVPLAVMRQTAQLMEQTKSMHTAVQQWRTATNQVPAADIIKKIKSGTEFGLYSSLEEAHKFARAFLDIIEQLP